MRHRFWIEGPGSFILAIGFALIIRWALLEAYVIPSGSMIPTLLINDHIFVNKISYGLRVPFSEDWMVRWGRPQRGEVVVFRFPGNKDLFYVKRIIGIPGDSVLLENGNLYVNNVAVERTIPQALQSDWDLVRDSDFPGDVSVGGKSLYVHWQELLDDHSYSVTVRKAADSRMNFGPVIIPEGHYFVLGDNRDNSEDSRAWKADAQLAEGVVTFWREKAGPPIDIPAGTKITTANSQAHFFTTQSVRIEGLSVEAPVKAIELGAIGNQPAGMLKVIEDESLAQRVNVSNSVATAGGVDKRFVPLDSIMGRASFVLLSCEQTLPVVSILCNPLTIRWSRFFHKVN